MNSFAVLGDGQLALMLGESAKRHEMTFIAVGQDADSPVASVFPDAWSPDLPESVFAVTLENEWVSSNELAALEDRGIFAVPDSGSYRHFETKIAQRRFFDSSGIPSPRWKPYLRAGDEADFGYPYFLKASKGGYDGYGVRKIENAADLARGLLDFGWTAEEEPKSGPKVYLESGVDIESEFAVGALFDGKGGMNMLPLVETVQHGGVCEYTFAPPRFSAVTLERITREAMDALGKFARAGLLGLFSFEFFYTRTGQVLINEGAPRPHNSQHLTREACELSQFDLLVRFLRERKLPLPDRTQVVANPSVMINLLGQSAGGDVPLLLPSLPDDAIVHVKMYGKKHCRPGRKMGHAVILARKHPEKLADYARALKEGYRL
jgi:5-(carboxyamino)imidazole ribonucleotide synthase